jgi:hypothetical protein
MIEVIGEINFYAEFKTVKEIREYVDILNKHDVPDETAVLDGMASVIFRGDVEPIECGEHLVSEGTFYDFLVTSHTHEDASDMIEPLGYSEAKFEGKV